MNASPRTGEPNPPRAVQVAAVVAVALVCLASSATLAQPRSEAVTAIAEQVPPATAQLPGQSLAPPNDDCANAIPLPYFGSVPFSTVGATTDGETTHACGPMEADVWFTIPGDVALNWIGTDWGADIAVYAPIVGCHPVAADLLDCGGIFACSPPGTLLVRVSHRGFQVHDTIHVELSEHCVRGAPGDPMVVASCGPPDYPNDDLCLLWYCDCYSGCITVPNDCDDDDICTRDACADEAPFCFHTPNVYGDLNHDDVVDAVDLAVVHWGLQDDFSTIPKKDIDLEPCNDPNDIVNLADALAVLRAMQGDPGCCGAAAGLPDAPAGTADGGALQARTPNVEGAAAIPADGVTTSASAPITPRLFWVPQGHDPADYASGTTRVFSAPGETECAELWIQSDQPFDTAGVQVRIDAASAFEGIGAEWIRADCESAVIDDQHPSFAGFGLWTVAVDQCDASPAGNITWLLHVTDPQDFVTLPTPPNALYLGEVCFDVATIAGGAEGEFTIDYRGAASPHTMIATANLTPWATLARDPLTIVVRPSNDACQDALPITTGVTPFDTSRATTDGDTSHACGPVESDVWFAFLSDCCGQIDVSATGGVDVAVYQPGADCVPTEAELIACAAGTDGVSAEITPLGPLLIRVGTDDGSTTSGDLTLDLTCTGSECTIGLPPDHPTTNTECGGAPDNRPGMCQLWYCDPSTCLCSIVADEQAVTCGDGDICTYDECIGTVCTNTPSRYGDVDFSGVPNVFDVFCILDGIEGQFDRCRFRDMDIEPCTGNGTLNVFDIFAVLDAIAGIDPCCS